MVKLVRIEVPSASTVRSSSRLRLSGLSPPRPTVHVVNPLPRSVTFDDVSVAAASEAETVGEDPEENPLPVRSASVQFPHRTGTGTGTESDSRSRSRSGRSRSGDRGGIVGHFGETVSPDAAVSSVRQCLEELRLGQLEAVGDFEGLGSGGVLGPLGPTMLDDFSESSLIESEIESRKRPSTSTTGTISLHTKIYSVTEQRCVGSTIFHVRLKDSVIDPFLKTLMSETGVGVRFGYIDVLQSEKTLPIPLAEARVKTFVRTKMMPVDMLKERISKSSSLSVDYVLFVSIAAVLAAVGLATGSQVTIVASMLVSPLMSPVFGLIFGTVSRDCKMVSTSLLTEFVGFLISLVAGAIIGLSMTPMVSSLNSATCRATLSVDQNRTASLFWNPSQFRLDLCWPNAEIIDRGRLESLGFGVVVSIASGFGAALSVGTGEISSLVGVAISAALLPPIVNAGMMVAFGLLGTVAARGGGLSQEERWEALSIAAISLILFLINVLFIYATGLLLLCITNCFRRRGELKRKKSPPPAAYEISLDGVELESEEEEEEEQHETVGEGGEIEMKDLS